MQIYDAAWTFWGLALLLFVAQRMNARATRRDVIKAREDIEKILNSENPDVRSTKKIEMLREHIKLILESENRDFVNTLKLVVGLLAFPIVAMSIQGLVGLISP
jgi:hypothetical protein